MAVLRIFAICLTMGLLGIATSSRGDAQQVDVGDNEFAAADAALAVSTARSERAAYEAKWLPAVKEMQRQIEIDAERTGIWIRMLEKINTPQSQALLRRIAVGEIKTRNPHDQYQAATSLLACDRTECWTLFSSSNPSVLSCALDAVAGQPVDEERMEILKTCAKHSITYVRYHAALVLAREAPRRLAFDALVCISQALDAIGPKADLDISEDRLLGLSQTPTEAAYLQIMFALENVRVDNQSLHQLAATKTGRRRDVINLALARRGDASVRESMLKLVQDPKAEMLRAWAVDGFSKIGSADDLPLLRNIARTDPLTRDLNICIRDEFDRPFYPVRQSANDAILAIELRNQK